MGELEQAKDYHQRALEININVLGPNHTNVATSYKDLGSVYKAMGENKGRFRSKPIRAFVYIFALDQSECAKC